MKPLLCIVRGCAAVGALASSAGAQTLVTANMTSNSISVVDVATGRGIATIPTGEGPHEVAISHDGKWAVVSIYGTRASIGNSLVVVDVARGAEARRIDLGEYRRPHGMAFLPGDRKLLVTSETTQRVLVVDFATGAIDTSIVTGQATTHMVALVPDGSRAYTTNIAAGTISVLDVAARRQDRTITVGTRIEGIAVTPDGREVWAGGNTSKTVYVVDVAAGTVAAQLTGFGLPYRMAITPDGRTAVITDPSDEKVHIVDVRTRRTRSVIAVPPLASPDSAGSSASSPQGVVIGADGRTAYVTLKAAGRVALIDIDTGRIVREISVGGGSDGVGVAPPASRPNAPKIQ
jgi:YVTN family beta-propeller protein